jgi:hypothetical protein
MKRRMERKEKHTVSARSRRRAERGEGDEGWEVGGRGRRRGSMMIGSVDGASDAKS